MDVREMSHEQIARFFAGQAPGEEKAEVMGDWLDANGWEAHYPHFMTTDEEAFCKNNIMLLVDKVGVVVYRKTGSKWNTIGGLGYLSMGKFPRPLYRGSRAELDLIFGTVRHMA